MAVTLTNSILTQIAIKRLSGKAMASGRLSVPEEEYGSTIQGSAETLFGQTVPNAPTTDTADLYKIQSASDGSPGTVQYVEFDLVVVPDTDYNAAAQGTGEGDGEAEETVFDQDLGTSNISTFHAYHLRLPADYDTQNSDWDTLTSTNKVLGTDAPYINSFSSTGSTQFQVVPEYLSTVIGTNNAYIPDVLATNDGVIQKTSNINYYFDSFAGILFVQDPVAAAGTDSNANVPEKLRAFLYVGKYQSEITADDTNTNFHISGSVANDGFTITTNASASFTSSIGLTISASETGNTLTFGYAGDTLAVTSSVATTASYAQTVDVSDNENEDADKGIVFSNGGSGSLLENDTSRFTYNPGSAQVKLGDEGSNGEFLLFRHAVNNDERFGIISFQSSSGGGSALDHKLTINGGSATSKGVIYIGTSSATASSGAPAQTRIPDNDVYLGGHLSTVNVRGRNITFNDGYQAWNNASDPAVIVSGNFTIDLMPTASNSLPSASFIIRNLTTSSGRTPLVIADGVITEADADFASDIVTDGGAVTSVALSTGDTNQGALDLTVNGTVQDDNIVPFGLGNTDSPTFSDLTLTGGDLIASTATTFNVFNTTATTINFGGEATTMNVGNGSGVVNMANDVFVAGNLTVQGTRTEIQVENLNVEDQFILLNSSSNLSAPIDGGIIVQTTASNAGLGKSGSAFFRDADAGLWAITSASVVAHNATTIGIDLTTGSNTMAAVVGVQIDNAGDPNTTSYVPFQGDTDDYRYGQMYVDTTDTVNGGLYIYLPSA